MLRELLLLSIPSKEDKGLDLSTLNPNGLTVDNPDLAELGSFQLQHIGSQVRQKSGSSMSPLS